MHLHKLYKGFLEIKNKIMNEIRTITFKLNMTINGVHYGKSIRVQGGIPLLSISYRNSIITIGDNVLINSYSDHSWNSRTKIIVRPNGKLSIGNSTGINGILIYCTENIQIGSYVKVGGGSRISDTDHHSTDWKLRRLSKGPSLHSPIVIEDDVFIGANCIILKGVKIGARSVVAAGSVVTKSIPNDELWGGVPAHLIKKLGN